VSVRFPSYSARYLFCLFHVPVIAAAATLKGDVLPVIGMITMDVPDIATTLVAVDCFS
jgi:hypothetical protein